MQKIDYFLKKIAEECICATAGKLEIGPCVPQGLKTVILGICIFFSLPSVDFMCDCFTSKVCVLSELTARPDHTSGITSHMMV